MKRDPSKRTPWKALLVIAAVGLFFRPSAAAAALDIARGPEYTL
jgi:hypothetical protein